MRYNITLTDAEYDILKQTADNMDVPMSKLVKQFIRLLERANADRATDKAYMICLTSEGAAVEDMRQKDTILAYLTGGDFLIKTIVDPINNRRTYKYDINLEAKQKIKL